jgi:hypothetical protein
MPSWTRPPSWTTETRPTLGARYAALAGKLPQPNVLGGCCGTDHREVGAPCEAWLLCSAAGA